MNRHRWTRPAPSYFEHFDKLSATGPVIYGPHLGMPPDNDGLIDPFKMARRFAHVMAQDTGEPFSWGWYAYQGSLRPAVCAAESAPRYLRIEGTTGPVDTTHCHKAP